jgi:hypothetical protein
MYELRRAALMFLGTVSEASRVKEVYRRIKDNHLGPEL